MAERAERRNVLVHIHRIKSREEKLHDFNAAVTRIRASGIPENEQEARIRKMESAHLGTDFSNVRIAETPKPKKRSRLERIIFRR